LKGISGKALGSKVAAFDTRFEADQVKSVVTRFVIQTGGYAAKRIADSLKKAGGTLVVPLEVSSVEDTEGLKLGEPERR
jgi:hypothetical protein